MTAFEHQLIWHNAPGGAIRVYSLEGEVLRLGRSARCDLVILHPEVSRVHARLSWREGRYWLEDLASTNGTWLNGRRLTPYKPVALEPGATIGLGPHVMLQYQCLEVAPTQAAANTPEDAEDEADDNIWPRVMTEEAAAADKTEATTPEARPQQSPAAEKAGAHARASAPPAGLEDLQVPEPKVPPLVQALKERTARPATVAQPGSPAPGSRPWPRRALLGCALSASLVTCALSGFLLWVDANRLWCDFFAWVPFLACR